MTEPIYQHNCDKCQFMPWPFRRFDVYLCPQQGNPALILRYGDDGPDYESVPLMVICWHFFTTYKDKEERS